MSPQNLSVGARIQLDTYLATVRYIGPVGSHSGDWLGVEWDDPSRGKHDGSLEGVRYFTCRHPKGGSFIRPSPKIQVGRPFLEALREKYQDSDVSDSASTQEVDVKLIGKFGENAIETVGFDRVRRQMSQLDRLRLVGLDFMRVSTAGDPGEILETCPNITELDLSWNLLSNWEEVANITKQLLNLVVLRLDSNHLQSLSSPPNFHNAFSKLTTLSLNKTYTSWAQMELLEPHLPALEALHLGFNQIHHLSSDSATPKVTGFSRLKLLNLEHNAIESSGEILRLSMLPSLEQLSLNSNPINKLEFHSEQGEVFFPRLRYLNISELPLTNWSDIDAVGQWLQVRDLRARKLPVYKGIGAEMLDVQLVGRVPNLEIVNGSSLTPQAREDMERYFLKWVVERASSTNVKPESLVWRYAELCKAYGVPVVDELAKKAASTTLKNRLVEITISSRETLKGPPIKAVDRKLLSTLTVRNLRLQIIPRLLGVPLARQGKLYCIQHLKNRQMNLQADREGQFVLELDDELRQLQFYDVETGDEVVVLVGS
ncbi:uncharacterized protein VTP21DRAFT_3847 [Calcarisporiella thermophila]|uniref:uncharacterized protein n=1 Tax=Calcarisporiella thermophila TaxID=911321 RepID=UPI003743A298